MLILIWKYVLMGSKRSIFRIFTEPFLLFYPLRVALTLQGTLYTFYPWSVKSISRLLGGRGVGGFPYWVLFLQCSSNLYQTWDKQILYKKNCLWLTPNMRNTTNWSLHDKNYQRIYFFDKMYLLVKSNQYLMCKMSL